MAQGKIGSLKYLLIIGLVGFFSLLVSFYIVSNQMNQEVQELSNDNFNRQVINNTTKNILKNKSKRVDKITARKRMEPNRQFIESVFFIKGKEVARHKSLNDKIFDFEGDAITGTVEFKSLIKDFYGIETYVNGKRNGPFKEYFAEGQLKREAYYLDDEVITNKDYFIDGKLRMEQNFDDASTFTSVSSREIGIGKVYFRTGRLRYEWQFTNAEFGGFNKSYNLDGILVEENYFDSFGISISKEDYDQQKYLE